GQRELIAVGQRLLSELVPLVNAQQGVMYVMDSNDDIAVLKQLASYADSSQEPRLYRVGEGLVGQCAAERQRILLGEVPRDLVQIRSRLLKARARALRG